MIAAQLFAAHNAAMECFQDRRAMIKDQTFEGHRENLSLANKRSRTYAVLLDGLNRHRGKGHQKVTVESRACAFRRSGHGGMVEKPMPAKSSRSEKRSHGE
jgi:hypothetical protein